MTNGYFPSNYFTKTYFTKEYFTIYGTALPPTVLTGKFVYVRGQARLNKSVMGESKISKLVQGSAERAV